MTDKQIIEAAEICRTGECKGCPCYELHTAGCVTELMKDVFDLINRQQAEIERLKEEQSRSLNSLYAPFFVPTIKAAKRGAVKEFAERLKEIYKDFDPNVEVVYTPMLFKTIDGLVKEMTEVQG